jgi:hypothetical protein
MKVKYFMYSMNELLEKKIINKNDEIIIIGTGELKTKILRTIVLPKFDKIDESIIDESKGFYGFGFHENK